MELCFIVRQRITKKIEESVKAAIGNILTMPPGDRADYIQKIRDKTFLDNDIMREYGLSLSDEMMTVKAEVIPAPTLQYATPDRDSITTFVPENGAWNLARRAFCQPVNFKEWALCCFAPRLGHDLATNFVRQLVQAARSLNMKLHEEPYMCNFTKANEVLPELVTKVMESSRNKCQICVCIIPTRDTVLYQAIKKAFENRCPTQCLVVERTPILNGKDRGVQGHLCNVLSKMNMKASGTNQMLSLSSSGRQILRRIIGSDKSCVVLGGDVTVPSVGYGAKKGTPDICSLVASLDDACTVFAHASKFQLRGSDTMIAFEDMFTSVMKKRSAQIQKWPKRIIYMRDGVNEASLEAVVQHEIRGIEKAYEMAGIAVPKIACIVVQKRHQTRFFANAKGDRNMNLAPGTVLVDNLSHPSKHFNFYLLSHAGIKGTSKPCRYFVLRNDFAPHVANMDFAHLIFELTHLYGRCQRSVSLPSPVYYAHLLGDRVKFLAQEHVETRLGISWMSDSDVSVGGDKLPAEGEQDMGRRAVEEANKYCDELCQKTLPMFYC